MLLAMFLTNFCTVVFILLDDGASMLNRKRFLLYTTKNIKEKPSRCFVKTIF